MRIRFRKILPDGRSVRFEKEEDEKDILTLNIIVWKERSVRSR
jgi:hypothetical protein